MPKFINVRDLHKEADEIKSEIDDLTEEINDIIEDEDPIPQKTIDNLNNQIKDLNIKLKEIESITDYVDINETLINDNYFEDYARDLADDIYGIKDYWPFSCIDWEQAADELKSDYYSVEYDGETYWYIFTNRRRKWRLNVDAIRFLQR